MSTLYVATNGLSVWSSEDMGETLLRMSTGTGLYSGSQVWALALHPSSTQVLLAGTNSGIYRLNQDRKLGLFPRRQPGRSEPHLLRSHLGPDLPEYGRR